MNSSHLSRRRVQLRRPAVALVVVLLVGVVALAFVAVQKPADPVVNGRPMSQWAWKLAGRWTGEHRSYSYPPDVRVAFQANRDAAIDQIILVVRNRPRALDRLRMKLARMAPESFTRFIAPERPRVRWAGLLALSHLARKEPNPRIAYIFGEAINDPDPLVRKVAAFELGPWIDPAYPDELAKLLGRALDDPSADVRRDACRRIILSSGNDTTGYTRQVSRLADRIESLARTDPSVEVRDQAALAIEELRRAGALLAGSVAASRSGRPGDR